MRQDIREIGGVRVVRKDGGKHRFKLIDWNGIRIVARQSDAPEGAPDASNRWADELQTPQRPPVKEPPNAPKKPPVEEPEDPPPKPPPPGGPPVKEPPNEPVHPPIKEPPPKDPDRQPPRKPPIRAGSLSGLRNRPAGLRAAHR